jgi:hypothetical protein
MKEINNVRSLIKEIENAKASGLVDLSTEEDLSLAVMNLISLEEHLFLTASKTGKERYLDLLDEVRQSRQALLAKLVDRHEGETWCISKHLLAATMRLIEVGTKMRSQGKSKEAEEVFAKAYDFYTIFWGLRLKLINLPEIKEAARKEKPWTLKDLVEELVDCCDE